MTVIRFEPPPADHFDSNELDELHELHEMDLDYERRRTALQCELIETGRRLSNTVYQYGYELGFRHGWLSALDDEWQAPRPWWQGPFTNADDVFGPVIGTAP